MSDKDWFLYQKDLGKCNIVHEYTSVQNYVSSPYNNTNPQVRPDPQHSPWGNPKDIHVRGGIAVIK